MSVDELSMWLFEQHPHLVLQWLHEMLEGTRQIPQEFSWLGFAEVATNLVKHKDEMPSSPPDLDWAYVAVLANEYIVHEAKEHGRFLNRYLSPQRKVMSRYPFEERLMGLRAEFIMRLGSVPGDRLLDSNHLVQWFFESLTLSPEEALHKCAAGREGLSPEERWELIRIRRKLALLQQLAERGLLPPHQELEAWLSIREPLYVPTSLN